MLSAARTFQDDVRIRHVLEVQDQDRAVLPTPMRATSDAGPLPGP